MSIEVLWYFCQSSSDLYKKCSLNTHMYRLSIFFNRVFLCVLSLSLSLPLMLREPKLSIKPAFLFSTRFLYLLPHDILYMVSEREG